MFEKLTKREAEVLSGISHGKTTKEIANALYLSDHTIISYRKTLCRKMNACNAPSMVRRGFELGILKAEDSMM